MYRNYTFFLEHVKHEFHVLSYPNPELDEADNSELNTNPLQLPYVL